VAGFAGLLASHTPLFAQESTKYRISARHFGDNPEAAKKAGMDGIEVGVGGPADKLRISETALQQRIKDQVKSSGVVVSSLSMDLLNSNPVATDSRAVSWLTQCIEAAKNLDAVGILVPFFGSANLLKGKELNEKAVNEVVAKMKEVAPVAKKAKVYLALENTCSAKQNIEILNRIDCEYIAAYYDIGNSTNGGYDVTAEIRELKQRICLIHFKDGGSYLGEGKIKMDSVAAALHDIKYQGWIVLETSNPSKNAEADCRRNADYIRKLMS
jgi:sugar phosphate isomerase/epimerase